MKLFAKFIEKENHLYEYGPHICEWAEKYTGPTPRLNYYLTV